MDGVEYACERSQDEIRSLKYVQRGPHFLSSGSWAALKPRPPTDVSCDVILVQQPPGTSARSGFQSESFAQCDPITRGHQAGTRASGAVHLTRSLRVDLKTRWNRLIDDKDQKELKSSYLHIFVSLMLIG